LSQLRFHPRRLARNLFVQKIKVDQQVGEELALVRGDLAHQGAFQFGALAAPRGLGPFGSDVRVGLAR
jgi:hypothetical protein